MRTRTILAAILGFAQPMFAVDQSEPAIDQALAPAATDAAAAPASDAGESSGDAPAAAGDRASDTSSSAAPASLSSDIAAAGAQHADPLPSVSIDVEDHAEARERFAGLLARLHGVEEDFVHALRNELNALGTLLHLHSVASGKADTTGDYSSSDLS
ncbi:hypothetical protein [Burkholderia cenocepacia]|uniref:hypothetical protein n=1 Tax=Burkholderia cenocepacia TaxID=95486 RepID=UPI003844023E